jgi:hypothetical protein
LNPNDVSDPGIGGTISYISTIPPSDSLLDLRVVAVPYFPVDTLPQALIGKVVEGIIPFSGDIRATAISGTTASYELYLRPQTYYYIAVVQQYGTDVFSQWKVVSVYGYTPSTPNPLSVSVLDEHFTTGINFTVDFYNVPPQPFKVP